MLELFCTLSRASFKFRALRVMGKCTSRHRFSDGALRPLENCRSETRLFPNAALLYQILVEFYLKTKANTAI